MFRSQTVPILLLASLAAFEPARADIQSAACPAPDVIFQFSPSHLYISSWQNCGIDFDERVLPTAASDAFYIDQSLELSGDYAGGLAQAKFHAIDGHCVLHLKTLLLVAGQVPVSCNPGLGIETIGDPGLNGLSVYVRGTTGTHYWTRGTRSGSASVTPHGGDLRRTASSVCCQALSGTPPSQCECDPESYDQPLGTIGVTNGSVDATLYYNNVEYHRVLRLRINNGCTGPASSSAGDMWVAIAESQYEIDAGIDPAPGGGERCADFRDCAWNSIDGIGSPPQLQELNNCYNYATHRRADPFTYRRSFAQVGRGSNFNDWVKTHADISPAAVDFRARRDGLVPSTRDGDCGGKCKVALVIAPGIDWHWLRKGSDGTWSHKPATGRATNKACDGSLLTDPETQLTCNGNGVDYGPALYYYCVPDGATILAPEGAGVPEAYSPVVAGEDTFELPPPDSLRIEHLCYSGRPNPFALLSPAERAELNARLQGLTPVPDPAWSWEGSIGDVQVIVGAPLDRRIALRDGLVEVSDTAGVAFFQDDNALASWAAQRVGACETTPTGGVGQVSGIRFAALSNPSRTSAHFVISGITGPVRLDVLDAQGRVIRSYDRVAPGGTWSLVWEGRDQLGRSAPAGMYLARLRARTAEKTVKFMFIR
jgi:hypothetical protein